MRLIRNVLVLMTGISMPVTMMACGGEDPATEAQETGTLQANLSAISSQGIEYRLRFAFFNISGPVYTGFSSEEFLGQSQALLTLPTGPYTIELYGSWTVERNDNNGTYVPVQAALVSPNPIAFQVLPNQTTGVAFAFNVNGEVIQFGDGQLQVTVSFDDTPVEDSWSRCSDGIDNDADGLIDCGDGDCMNAGFCAGAPENHPVVCEDGIDNDLDGWIDCQDFDCAGMPLCTGTENTDTGCSDGMDNDMDGWIDCQDFDCTGLAVCGGVSLENTAAACADGVDNDFDGFADCNDADCVNSGFCSGQPPFPGSLVVSEVMYNPAVVPDADGEWFEIQNISGSPMDLSSCELVNLNNGMVFLVPGGVISAGGFGVVARNGDQVLNGGVAPLVTWPGMVLGNSTGTLQIRCNGTIIDELSYDNVNFSANGASIQLDAFEVQNDLPSAWCVSSTPFGMGDRGTPGSANFTCP